MFVLLYRIKPLLFDNESDNMKDERDNISYFVSFCVEQFKNAKKMTGEAALSFLDSYKVLDYLAENYEALHTQSHQWILEDIDEFINNRKWECYDTFSR